MDILSFLSPYPDPVVYFVPFFILLIIVELIINYKSNVKIHDPKDSFASIGMGLGSVVLGIGVKATAFLIFTFLHQFAIFEIGWAWWAWILILFADDFSFYWHHRLSHQIRVLWAAHVNHHSSVNYNLAVALRQSWVEIFYKYIFWLWLPIIGFEPIMIMTMMSFSLIYQFWIHTRTIKSLGPLEWVLNTPSHHRVHHASDVKYLDRNHAGIFIIWDRMFGTFQKEEEDPTFGITKNIETYNLFEIAFHEYKALWKDVKNAKTFKDKINYLIMPPGWSPDGSTKTADELREELGLK